MMGLPGSDHAPEPVWRRATKKVRKQVRKSNKAVMKSYHFKIPVYDIPVRLRPWFVFFTTIIMFLLAFLGFTNFSHGFPVNDKLLHFFCLMLATAVFYFIFDVEDDARRIWYWRRSPIIFTGFVCFVLGGIVSEFIQSLLPQKEFQFGDIVANILGSSLGLLIAYYLERYYRHRREIHRLYRPLNTSVDSLSDEEDDLEAGTQLLPLASEPMQQGPSSKPATKSSRLEDVWDEREELFDIGEESEEEEGVPYTPHTPHTPNTPKGQDAA
ncbi:hypothetical protein EIP91_003946 [Steccherinum ochraceum]|uniref:VanZ-like domain-containing protein n=1 Tax=Steccherinum ochraceum TaxID=92696 RepID=A0A4V2MXJ5_9APHY|nr:hypothetical protein EIP91_003946 [Steccherinum ochraceum]